MTTVHLCFGTNTAVCGIIFGMWTQLENGETLTRRRQQIGLFQLSFFFQIHFKHIFCIGLKIVSEFIFWHGLRGAPCGSLHLDRTRCVKTNPRKIWPNFFYSRWELALFPAGLGNNGIRNLGPKSGILDLIQQRSNSHIKYWNGKYIIRFLLQEI